jgi:hypothetical protein
MGLKLAEIGQNDQKKAEKSLKIGQFGHLMNLNHCTF